MTKYGVELIKQYEGFRKAAYADPVHGWSVPTIGYGTTVYANGQKVKQTDTITEENALKELSAFIDKNITPSLKKIPFYSEMSEKQIGALESFAYNLGPNFYGSEGFNTITKRLKEKDWDNMESAFMLYINKGTPAEPGLRLRRSAETALWISGLKKETPTKKIEQELASIKGLESLNAASQNVLKSLATYTAQDVEKGFKYYTGTNKSDEKLKVAKQLLEGLLNDLYNNLDKQNNFPATTDLVAKTVIIPLIPEAIEWAVNLMNTLNIFQKEKK